MLRALVARLSCVARHLTPHKGHPITPVKNLDNSENSSSSAIRNGTDIKKWFRTFSKKPGSNWEAFPDEEIKGDVSEEGFRQYVKKYLEELRKDLT